MNNELSTLLLTVMPCNEISYDYFNPERNAYLFILRSERNWNQGVDILIPFGRAP